jgi:hypothetical protein
LARDLAALVTAHTVGNGDQESAFSGSLSVAQGSNLFNENGILVSAPAAVISREGDGKAQTQFRGGL